MRGQDVKAGLKFSATKRPRAGIPAYLWQDSMSVAMMQAYDYDIRKNRHIPPIFQAQPDEQVINVPRKVSYTHVAKIPDGGWGHVPGSNPVTIARREKIEELRQGVKIQC